MKGGQACHVGCRERDERNAEVKVEGSNVSSTLLATTAVFRIHQVASRPRWDVVTSPCNLQSGAVLKLRGA